MSLQNDEDSDFDFSVIDKKACEEGKLNFSVEKLLEQDNQPDLPQMPDPQEQDSVEQLELESQSLSDDHKDVKYELGSFMHDLQKFEEELSFETQVYNVYQEESQDLNGSKPTKSFIHAKTNSFLKTTKQDSQQPTNNLNFDDYGYLVLDFSKQKRQKRKKYCQPNQKCHTVSYNRLHSETSEGTNTNINTNMTSEISGSSALKSKYNKKVALKSNQKSLNKLLSPQRSIKILTRIQKSKSNSKKITLKERSGSKGKSHINGLSKNKSPSSKHSKYNSSSSTNAPAETSSKTKSSTKTSRQNAYSEYYGFQQEDLGSSDRYSSKSNCLGGKPENRYMVVHQISSNNRSNASSSKGKNGVVKSGSKSRKSFNSPSAVNKDNISSRFKKKKF